MRLYFALLSLISCNFYLVGAYSPQCGLVSRFAHTPITPFQQSFARSVSNPRNRYLRMMVPENNPKSNLGLFPVPRTVRKCYVDFAMREKVSPVGEENSQKSFLGKLYDATLGKFVALFLHLMVRFTMHTYCNLYWRPL